MYDSKVLNNPQELMRVALQAAALGNELDVPIGAVICNGSGSIIALARNSVVTDDDCTSHAEIVALRKAGLSKLLEGHREMTMAVTLEPCPMCAWAIRDAGIARLVFGAYNSQYGAAGSIYDLLRDGRVGLSVEVVGGVMQAECQSILVDFFSKMRNNEPR